MPSAEVNTDFVLVNPNTGGSYRNANMQNEYPGLGYLSASLRSVGLPPQIIDSRLSNLSAESTIVEVMKISRKLVGIAMFTENAVPWVRRLTAAVKEESPGTHVVLGGYYPTLQTERALDMVTDADSVVRGEGELTLMELAQRINEGEEWRTTSGIAFRGQDNSVRYTEAREPVRNLDSLPYPDRYADEDQINEILMEGSRGCFNRCVFCALRPFIAPPDSSTAWRGRSPEHIVGEMRILLKEYPSVKRFRFIDPCFFGSGAMTGRNMELARLIREKVTGAELVVEGRVVDIRESTRPLLKELKRAGLKEMYVGLEAGSEKILKKMKKGFRREQALESLRILEKEGIFYEFGFMMFTPWTTEADMDDNISFLQQTGFLDLHLLFRQMDVIPSTDAMKKSGKLIPKGGSGYFTYENVPPVEDLKNFAKIFESSQRRFFEDMFGIYDRIRIAYEAGNEGIIGISKEFNDLIIGIFTYCRDNLNKCNGHEALAADCVRKYGPLVKNIDEKLKT